MILHLVNGFLGSGKTTAIITATKTLIDRGKTVGIVTNDKGRFQVDTAFFQSMHIPTQQVTGGCFRCSFSEFEEKIAQLQETEAPDIIFAESVGSCVDLVNTIFTPLQANTVLQVEKTTYSVFADIRLFRYWIDGEPLPFSDAINYLFAKQIEEGNLLVLNKADLLALKEREETLADAAIKYPQKTILLQDSRDAVTLSPWLVALDKAGAVLRQEEFKVDYPTYKGGEQEMAWLDSILTLESWNPRQIRAALIELIGLLLGALQEWEIMVGHLKIFLPDTGGGTKISFTTADLLERPLSSQWKAAVPEADSPTLSVTLNARAVMKAEDFSAIVKHAIQQTTILHDVQIRVEPGSAYNPEMSMARPC